MHSSNFTTRYTDLSESEPKSAKFLPTVIDVKLFSSVLLIISTFQASTFIIMFGLLFIFLENHLDGRAIVCQGGDQYARYEKQTNSTRK